MASPLKQVQGDKSATHGIRRVPVVDSSGKLVGIVALDDVLVLIGQEMQNIAAALKVELGVK